jgi:hypothetical protein
MPSDIRHLGDTYGQKRCPRTPAPDFRTFATPLAAPMDAPSLARVKRDGPPARLGLERDRDSDAVLSGARAGREFAEARVLLTVGGSDGDDGDP